MQNSPTLSVVNDETTSGALGPPARSAWLILSSVMLPTALTWMLGCTFSKASMVAWIAFDLAGRAPAVPERDGHVGVRVVVGAALATSRSTP